MVTAQARGFPPGGPTQFWHINRELRQWRWGIQKQNQNQKLGKDWGAILHRHLPGLLQGLGVPEVPATQTKAGMVVVVVVVGMGA